MGNWHHRTRDDSQNQSLKLPLRCAWILFVEDFETLGVFLSLVKKKRPGGLVEAACLSQATAAVLLVRHP